MYIKKGNAPIETIRLHAQWRRSIMFNTWDDVKNRLNTEPLVDGDLYTQLLDQFAKNNNRLDSLALLNGFLAEPLDERARLIDRMIVHECDDLWFAILRWQTPCELMRMRELAQSMRLYAELVVPHQLANASPLNRVLNEVYIAVLSRDCDNTLFPDTDFLHAHFFSRSWYANDDEYDKATLTTASYFTSSVLTSRNDGAYVMYSDMPAPDVTPVKDANLLNWLNQTRLNASHSLYNLYKSRPGGTGHSGYHRLHQELLVPGLYGMTVRYTVGSARTRLALQYTVQAAYRLMRTQHISVETDELVALFRGFITELRAMPPDTPLETILGLLDQVCRVTRLDAAHGGEEGMQQLCLEAKQGVRDAVQRRFNGHAATDDFKVLFRDNNYDSQSREERRASYDWLLPPVPAQTQEDQVVIRRQEAILWLNMLVCELMVEASLTKDEEDVEVVVLADDQGDRAAVEPVQKAKRTKDKSRKKSSKQKEKDEKKRIKQKKEKEKKKRHADKKEKKRRDKSKKKKEATATDESDSEVEASQRRIKKRKLARVSVTEMGDGTRLLSVIKGSGLLQITGGGNYTASEYSTIHCVSRGFTMRLSSDTNYAVYAH